MVCHNANASSTTATMRLSITSDSRMKKETKKMTAARGWPQLPSASEHRPGAERCSVIDAEEVGPPDDCGDSIAGRVHRV